MDKWMRDMEEQRRHDELSRKMDAQTNAIHSQPYAINSQTHALRKQNALLEKEHERQIEKEYKDRIFQLQLHLAQASDDSQRLVFQQMLDDAENDYSQYLLEKEERQLAAARRRQLSIFISLLVLLVGMFGVYYVYTDMQQVRVPELRGVSLAEAKEVLRDEGFVLGTVTEIGGQTVEPGQVSLSTPSGGSKVKRGKVVDLIVAKEETATSETSSEGTASTTSSSQVSSQTFTIEIERTGLSILQAPYLTATYVATIDPGTYTIVETTYNDGHSWGKLKSGQGWISLTEVQGGLAQVNTKDLTTEQVQRWVAYAFFMNPENVHYNRQQPVISVYKEEDDLVYADVTMPSDSDFEPSYWRYRVNAQGELEHGSYEEATGNTHWYVLLEEYRE
ncbi:TPA: PASTA domain-containing protein [Streptococcus suis]|nr:PASTA domain-containing protein [Streptococcus suis]